MTMPDASNADSARPAPGERFEIPHLGAGVVIGPAIKNPSKFVVLVRLDSGLEAEIDYRRWIRAGG